MVLVMEPNINQTSAWSLTGGNPQGSLLSSLAVWIYDGYMMDISILHAQLKAMNVPGSPAFTWQPSLGIPDVCPSSGEMRRKENGRTELACALTGRDESWVGKRLG
ncbi:hypothetical protein RRG08_038619 [Elysia crispata]|uniref:Uncharacterized protein n=1 Tax=Elysia crispata TaxID=231223 RepID=A0AAE0YLI3_9GAST|nr:hypothetical protein RRG08_038619 [Elysia crispata]